jgi:hydrogenase expression/formation protein HypC
MCLAIPGQVLSIDEGGSPLFRQGRVAFGTISKAVSLACLPQVTVGQYVLVHAGIAIAVIDEQEAQRVFALLAQLDDPGRTGAQAT